MLMPLPRLPSMGVLLLVSLMAGLNLPLIFTGFTGMDPIRSLHAGTIGKVVFGTGYRRQRRVIPAGLRLIPRHWRTAA